MRADTVDLRAAAVFVRVVEAGSFSAAAKRAGVPTSSVSRAVARLEDALGVRLLHRTTRKLTPTDAGQAYFRRMQAVMNEADEATREAVGAGGQVRGTVRLTAPVDLGLQSLPPIVAALVVRHPGLLIELSLTSRRVDLLEEGIDLAIRGGILEDSSLVSRKIGGTPLAIFAAPAYLARRGTPRAMKDVARHDCVLYRGRGGLMPWRLVGPRGMESAAPTGPLVVDDMAFVRDAVAAGVGLGMMPAAIAAPDVAAGRLVHVLPRHALDGGGLYLVWPSRRLLPARVAVVRDFLAEELAKII